MPKKKVVVMGFLGSTLDAAGLGAKRWDRWRPTVALFQQEDLVIDRLELLYSRKFTRLAQLIEKDIGQVSPESTVRLHEFELLDPWDLGEVYGALFDFARGQKFDTDKEDYLVHITTGTHIAQICMFLLTESRHLPARLIQTSPSKRKGGTCTIIDLDLSKYDQLASRFHLETKEGLSFLKAGIDTHNAAYNRLVERIERVAIQSPDPLLLCGPTGSGKSKLARRIFELKKARKQVAGELVEFNCATLRGDGAMSTLFGHVKGAFTGAVESRPGLLRKADKGILFLDEVGELGLDEQAMLLRAIEDKTFYPVGSDREVHSDFQLLAGTNRDLAAHVAAGRFREDLFARINLWTFVLPGLRERHEDLAPNLDFELDQCGRSLNRNLTMSREARERFLQFAASSEAIWAGNFRDFGAAIRRMATLSEGSRISAGGVEEEIERLRHAWRRPDGASGKGLVDAMLGERASELDRFDRVQLEDVLAVCRGAKSLSDAGRQLFAVSRKSKTSSNDADRLRKYLARFGLSWEDVSGVTTEARRHGGRREVLGVE